MTPPTELCTPRWLSPLLPSIPEISAADWEQLGSFEDTLREQLSDPTLGELAGRAPSRSEALLQLRQHFARHPATTPDDGEVLQLLRQAVCGYYDLDLRDTTGLGHGRLIAHHAHPAVQKHWLPRLTGGELAGIAMTEAHGGSRTSEITTRLLPAVHGGWVLTGTKSWISRLNEAAVWTVSARNTHGELVAVVVDASSSGLHRQPREPAGLAGWSWGTLTFDAVPISAKQILTGPGGGAAIFAEHLTDYRPLVTVTALGTAAAVHDTVTTGLAHRESTGEINRARDHALIVAGRTHAQINAGLLACLHAQRLAATGHEHAELWGRTTKAHGVDLARHAADELTVLVGASGFQTDTTLQKARRDLDALRYADGMHDSLYRAAGRHLLTTQLPNHQATGTQGHHHDLRADDTG